MSLKSKPLLVFKGLNKKPLHGNYAGFGQDGSVAAAIHGGMENAVVITFDDANRHVLTIGSSGMGKTTISHAPAVDRLISTGCSGIVFDVKGEYRHLAEQYPDQVIVIGADDDAAPYNLIQGMSDEQFAAFLEEFRPKTRDSYWGSMGIQDAKFIRKTYRLMGQEATLADIVTALKTPKSFVKLCDAFVKFASSLPMEYMSLLDAVISNRFGILAMGESELLGLDAPGMEEVQKQYSWHTNGIVSVLEPFSNNACLREKFSPKPAEDGEEESPFPSMEDLLYRDRKVLLLDLPVDRFGSTAHVISKLMRIRMIATITGFHHHKEIECGDRFYTFFAADEYQHLVNVDQGAAAGGLYDDTAFFDRCRAYGHINLIATQSRSALLTRAGSLSAINCLLQNIGTVIAFSTLDPETDRLLQGRVSAMDAEHISSVVRSDLPVGEAFVLGRSLKQHGNATVVSRIRGCVIPGMPHMSKYFEGMHDPLRTPVYSEESEYMVNPHHQPQSKPPLASAHVIRRSFKDNLHNVLQDLEVTQALVCPEFPDCDVVLMQDADYTIQLAGPLTGDVPTLWQPGLSLEITSHREPGWSCTLPMAVIMPFVEEHMTPPDRRVREHKPLESGVAQALLGSHDGAAFSSIEVRVPEKDDEPGSPRRMVTLRTGEAFLEFPEDYWNCLCKCLGHLESQYSRADLSKYSGGDSDPEPDPFDVFFPDE